MCPHSTQEICQPPLKPYSRFVSWGVSIRNKNFVPLHLEHHKGLEYPAL